MYKYHVMYFLDYGKYFGGAANTLLQQAILMHKMNYKVTIVISDYLGESFNQKYIQICVSNKIDLIQLTYPISSHPEDIDIVSVIQNYDEVKNKVKEIQPDILHSIQINPIVELISRELYIPHVMNIYPLLPSFFSISYTNIFPRYHICDSNYYAEKWEYYLGTESVCIRTVVNNSEQIRKRFAKNNSLNCICVGIIEKGKNQLEVIKAFQYALQQGFEGCLSLYGYDNFAYGIKCQQYVIENGLEENIFFKGFCTNMQEEYQKNDILICGSKRESYPNAISEALANGLIVISTPVAGVPEVIIDHDNGYLCKGFTKEDIAEKLLELNSDRNTGTIDKILNNAYKTFEHYHSPECITKELDEYYNYLVKGSCSYEGILISEIREKFAEIITLYKSNINYFSNVKEIERKIWYIYHIRDIVNKKISEEKKLVYIWGIGKYVKGVKELLDIFWCDSSFKGYIDTYKKGEFLSYKIYNPLDVIGRPDSLILIAAINGQDEMIEQLELNGKSFNMDYFILSPRSW